MGERLGIGSSFVLPQYASIFGGCKGDKWLRVDGGKRMSRESAVVKGTMADGEREEGTKEMTGRGWPW
jgi:hypothetical protein